MSFAKKLSPLVILLSSAVMLILAIASLDCTGKKNPVRKIATAETVKENVVLNQPTGEELTPTSEAVKPVDQCDFIKVKELRMGNKFDIFGTEAFDTVVCGYLVLRNKLGGESSEVPITVPYLVITNYSQKGFAQSLEGVMRLGNSAVAQEGDHYLFNCGCFKEGHIEGTQYEENVPYIDSETEKALLASSATNPVALVLSFGTHLGRGCICCNLAHQIRLY